MNTYTNDMRPRLLQDVRESVTAHSDEDVDMGRRPFGGPPEPQAGRAEANLWNLFGDPVLAAHAEAS